MSDKTPAAKATPPPAPPVKNSEEYFNSSRLKVIGTITAAVVAVGALGGIVGVAFDPDPVHADQVTPISDQGGSSSGGGQSKPLLGSEPDWHAAFAPAVNGSFVSLTSGIEVWVPDGWRTAGNEQGHIYMGDTAGSFAFVAGGEITASTAASDVIGETLSGLLPAESYTQLQVTDVVPWGDPFGTVTSASMVEYQALYVDDQGSAPVYGQIYAGTRNDGLELVFLIERTPPEGFNDAYNDIPLVTNTFARFGGVA